MATAGKDGIIRTYDTEKRNIVVEMKGNKEIPGHSNRVQCVKYHPFDGRILYSGGWDKTLLVHDMRVHEPVTSIYGPLITGESIDIHPNENKVLTGSYKADDCLELWDLR